VPAAASLSFPEQATRHAPGILSGQPWTACFVRNLNLRAHCRMMGRAWLSYKRSGHDACFRLFALLCQMVEERSRIFTDLHPNQLPAVPALFRMAWHARCYVRRHFLWRPDPAATAPEQWQSLVSHLFERWPVPPAFAMVWFVPGPVRHIERDWYCHVASGGSLRQLPGMLSLRSGAVREVLKELPCGTVRLTVRRGQLTALRCPEPLRQAVLASQMAVDFANDGIWIPLLEKYIADRRADVADFGLVVDGFRLMISESGTRRASEMMRHPLRELVCHWKRKWREYLTHAIPDHPEPAKADLRLPWLRARIMQWLVTVWSPMQGVAPFTWRHGSSRRRLQHWSITELCTQRDLVREGVRMRHCVALYVKLCHLGRNAIFHMRMQTSTDEDFVYDRAWTIRVRVAVRRVVEVKGYRNRYPASEAMEIVRMWAAQNGLRMSSRL
jgi:hypothetical protein